MPNNSKRPAVSILMGSDSDLPVMKEASDLLKQFGIACEVRVLSAHRTPEETIRFARTAEENGVKVIIAAAGGAAHLAGVVAALTELPVIGVPIKSKSFQGIDSLLAMIQMPPGIPVATMAVDGAKNAAIFAAKILAGQDPQVKKILKDYREKLRQEVIKKDEKVIQETQ